MFKKIFIFAGFLALYQLYQYYMVHYYKEPIIHKRFTIFHCFPSSFKGDLIVMNNICYKRACQPVTDTLMYYYNDKGCRIGDSYEFPVGRNIRISIDKEYFFEYDFQTRKIIREEKAMISVRGDRIKCDSTDQFAGRYAYELIRSNRTSMPGWQPRELAKKYGYEVFESRDKKDSIAIRTWREIDNQEACNCAEEFYQLNKNKKKVN